MRKNVALLVGGWSAERQVSLDKGKEVEAALKEAGYNVNVIEVTRNLADLIAQLTPKPDVVFNNLYGRGGEDGIIQSVLELLEIPYTHSGVMASAVAMDKPTTKRIAMTLGIQSPEGVVAHRDNILEGAPFDPPYVVKPGGEGSSVGVTIVREGDNQSPFSKDWEYGEYALVERFIEGRELTVAVLDGQAQDVLEIRLENGFFDYEAKYSDVKKEYLLPAPIPDDVRECAMDWAERIYIALGCHGLARCDFVYDDRIDAAEHALYFLEINTQPGLTAESIGPLQVVRNGMSFPDLCAHLVETAKCHEINQSTHPEAPAEAA